MTGGLAGSGAMGVNGDAGLAGTSVVDAVGQLVVSAVADLTGTGLLFGVITNANVGGYRPQQQPIIDDEEVLWLVTSVFMKIAA